MKLLSVLRTCACLFVLVAPPSPVSYASGQDAIDGIYCGKALSGGEIVEVTTTLTTQANGLLSGQYEFEDEGEITPGTLREYNKSSESRRTLIWVDKYGTGQLIIDFDQPRHTFKGNWGVYTDTPTFQWDGTRCSVQSV